VRDDRQVRVVVFSSANPEFFVAHVDIHIDEMDRLQEIADRNPAANLLRGVSEQSGLRHTRPICHNGFERFCGRGSPVDHSRWPVRHPRGSSPTRELVSGHRQVRTTGFMARCPPPAAREKEALLHREAAPCSPADDHTRASRQRHGDSSGRAGRRWTIVKIDTKSPLLRVAKKPRSVTWALLPRLDSNQEPSG
jgi:hypothetical protein